MTLAKLNGTSIITVVATVSSPARINGAIAISKSRTLLRTTASSSVINANVNAPA